MRQTIDTLLSSYEKGSLSRRDLLAGLTMMAAGATTAAQAAEVSPFKAVSVNHIAINVTDLKKSTAFYKDTFGLTSGMETDKESALRFGDCGLIVRQAAKPGITHYMFGVANYDAKGLEAWLRKQGLEPRKDQDSFHVKDPDGMDVQIGDKDMRGTSQAPADQRHLTPTAKDK